MISYRFTMNKGPVSMTMHVDSPLPLALPMDQTTYTTSPAGSSQSRSRPIAIKRSSRTSTPNLLTDDYEVCLTTSERHYDEATWRMYHRIVEHRQKNSTSQNAPESKDSASGLGFLPLQSSSTNRQDWVASNDPHVQFEDANDGIFLMDS